MEFFWFGVGLGVAFSMPIGPVALSLVGSSAIRGRRFGVRALLGACLGHAVLGVGALLLVEVGFDRVGAGGVAEKIVALTLCAMGILLVCRSAGFRALVERVEHPVRTVFVLSVANPMAAASWLALLHSGVARHPSEAPVVLLLGAQLGTAAWHSALVLSGARIPPRGMLLATKAGGAALVAVGAGALAS